MTAHSDWNDLHCATSLQEVRKQFIAAMNAAQPAPAVEPLATPDESASSPAPSEPEAPKVAKFDIEQVIGRFSLVEGTTKVLDMERKKELKKSAFIALVGKDLAKVWEGHEQRTVISEGAARAAVMEGQGGGSLQAFIDRFLHIFPTKDAWDSQRFERVPVEVLKIKMGALYPAWLNHPGRREIQHEQLVFDPSGKTVPGLINTFRGLPLEPLDEPNECHAIRGTLAHLCNHDEAVIHWVTCWLALPLQKPGTKMATALLFDSDVQGSGKSLVFAELHRRLYGRNGTVVGQHQLESQYTEWRSECMYSCFEEILSQSTKYNHAGTMKHMITGKTQRLEKKFVSGWEESNYMNCVFLSNELLPFPIDQADRRYMVVWPRKKLPDGMKTAFDYELRNKGAEAWYGYLAKYPIGDFTPYTEPLMTDARQRLINMSMRSYETFYLLWKRGELDVPYQTCLVRDLFAVYLRWCTTAHENRSSEKMFAGFLETRERKKYTAYSVGLSGQSRRYGTFVLISEQPPDTSESEWLGECVRKFQVDMGADATSAA